MSAKYVKNVKSLQNVSNVTMPNPLKRGMTNSWTFLETSSKSFKMFLQVDQC
jgi:hypothetical protein